MSFTERIVNIITQEQQEDWYLKLNPKGEVPVLQHGLKFTPDSEAIIDYLDQHCPEGITENRNLLSRTAEPMRGNPTL